MSPVSQFIRKTGLILLALAGLSAYPVYLAFTQNSTKVTLYTPQKTSAVQTDLKKLQIPHPSVAKTVCQELDQTHDKLLQALIDTYALPDHAWQRCLAELRAVKESDDLLLADPSQIPVNNLDQIDEISALLYSYNINPKRVRVIPTQSNSYFVSAGQGMDDAGNVIHELRINFEKLHQKSSEIQEAIIKHELQHVLQYDSLEFSFITGLLQEHGISLNELYKNAAFIAYKRHIEYRADLKAAAQDIEIAKAFAQDFKNYLDEQPEKAEKQFSSHPSKKDRYQAMSNLIASLEAEKENMIA